MLRAKRLEAVQQSPRLEPTTFVTEPVEAKSVISQEPVKVLEVTNCSGCGVTLQTTDKEVAGFIDKGRLRRLYSTQPSDAKPAITGSEQERLLIEHLKSTGAPKEVIDEIYRVSSGS